MMPKTVPGSRFAYEKPKKRRVESSRVQPIPCGEKAAVDNGGGQHVKFLKFCSQDSSSSSSECSLSDSDDDKRKKKKKKKKKQKKKKMRKAEMVRFSTLRHCSPALSLTSILKL